MPTIEAPHYEQARQRLAGDPVVKAMAEEIRGVDLSKLAHDDGTPRADFMHRANDEYYRRAGRPAGAHIGAVAEAVIRLLKG